MLRIEGWARDGLTDEQIAHNIGISCGRFYEWEKKFNEFRDAVKKGKAPVDLEVENALLKRALGYSYEEITTEIEELPNGKQKKHIKKTTKIVVPDTMAQIYWLNNRKPDRWKNRKAAESEQPNVTLEKAKEILGGVRSVIDG